jgi:hypothetical protein
MYWLLVNQTILPPTRDINHHGSPLLLGLNLQQVGGVLFGPIRGMNLNLLYAFEDYEKCVCFG